MSYYILLYKGEYVFTSRARDVHRMLQDKDCRLVTAEYQRERS